MAHLRIRLRVTGSVPPKLEAYRDSLEKAHPLDITPVPTWPSQPLALYAAMRLKVENAGAPPTSPDLVMQWILPYYLEHEINDTGDDWETMPGLVFAGEYGAARVYYSIGFGM